MCIINCLRYCYSENPTDFPKVRSFLLTLLPTQQTKHQPFSVIRKEENMVILTVLIIIMSQHIE